MQISSKLLTLQIEITLRKSCSTFCKSEAPAATSRSKKRYSGSLMFSTVRRRVCTNKKIYLASSMSPIAMLLSQQKCHVIEALRHDVLPASETYSQIQRVSCRVSSILTGSSWGSSCSQLIAVCWRVFIQAGLPSPTSATITPAPNNHI